MAHNPLGFGHVYNVSNTRKSARLNTNILVSKTIIHLYGVSLTALTSDLQLVYMIDLDCAMYGKNYNHPISSVYSSDILESYLHLLLQIY